MTPPDAADAVGRALVEAGATDVFGLLGSGNFRIGDAAVRAGATFHSSRHETGAVAMADGYARSTGHVGVATVHHGPGLTNALTALAEAAKSGTRLLLVTGAVAADDPWSNFVIDQDALVAATGAEAITIEQAGSARGVILDAMQRTEREDIPVVVAIPVDVQRRPMPTGDRSSPAAGTAWLPPPPADVEAIADLVEQSRRPIVLAGRGAVRDARASLLALGDRIGALLATTAGAGALFNGAPNNLGIAGGFASPAAKRLMRRADLLLAFGASMNPWTMNHGSLFGEQTRIVQVDRRTSALGRQHRVDVGIRADARLTAAALDAQLTERHILPSTCPDDADVDEAAKGWVGVPFTDQSDQGRIDPRTLTVELERRLPPERTVAIDSGLFMGFPASYLSAPDPQGFLFAQGFMSVGLGLGVGLGAAIGRPDRLAVIALGDGGALMSLGEFETMARHELPMLVLIYNDAAYGAEVHDFAATHHDGLVSFPDTDFAGIARTLGMNGVTVRHMDDLHVLGDWLRERPGPLVLDAKVNPVVVAGVWAE
jgi:thiamine pyrophosphate-dependent acetolactate synthase large subunit-like protein